MATRKRVLVVGAGFAGAVYSRILADAGFEVDVIDQRDHIAGNAFDRVDENGIRVHRYGPHIFHTSNKRVFNWLMGFGNWVPYEHRVRALLDDGRFVPIPVNLTTINTVFGTKLKDERATLSFLATKAEPNTTPRNAGEYLNARVGRELTDLFFRPYTKKMWMLDLEELDDSVVRRIPFRYDYEDRYFPNDRFQIMPRDGYTEIFAEILGQSNIKIFLQTAYTHGMERDYLHCFNSMPIDVFFDYCLGELPYRSIRFHHYSKKIEDNRSWSVTNFVDFGKFTRETWWHIMPQHLVRETGLRTITLEEPCDYKDNQYERYYPVKTADGRYQQVYQAYKRLADSLPNMDFIGRCGTYQYLDMDQVINQSLMSVEKWLESRTV